MRFSPLDSSEDFMGRCGLRFSLSLMFPSYDVINDVIMRDADCTPGREPRSVAASMDYNFVAAGPAEVTSPRFVNTFADYWPIKITEQELSSS